MKPWVYIACPYSKGDTGQHVRQSCLAWDSLQTAIGDRAVVVNPLWSHLQHMIAPRPWADWLAYDLALLESLWASGPGCILRLPGESAGADRETAWAAEKRVRIVETEDRVRAWLAEVLA